LLADDRLEEGVTAWRRVNCPKCDEEVAISASYRATENGGAFITVDLDVVEAREDM